MGDRLALELSARLDALAAAAVGVGASADAVLRLLEACTVATMRAVALELSAGGLSPAVDAQRPVLSDLRDAA